MSTRLFKLSVVTGVAFIVTLFLLQPILFSDDQKSTQTKQSMKAMHEHCNQASGVLDQINTKIEQAHKTNDVARLHESLSEIQKSVAEAKNHIHACMGMDMKKTEEHKH